MNKLKSPMADKNMNKIIWFHRPSCPHCQVMKLEWEEFSQNSPDVIKMTIDTSKPENQKLVAKFNISAVPQIIKIKKNDDSFHQIYKGERKANHIKLWSMM